MSNALPLISVVFVTYDRLASLRPTLACFLANTQYPRDRLEMIVTDDGSPPSVIEALDGMGFDRICRAPARSGLGGNCNRGFAAATGDYVLQLQDDWECVGPPTYLQSALQVLDEHAEVGMVILNQHPLNLPHEVRASRVGPLIRIFENRPERHITRVADHAYTDWPHLKRRSFVEAIGPYSEDRRMWVTELDYARRINAQRRFFVADIDGLSAFSHTGEQLSFNRGSLRARISNRVPAVLRRSLRTAWSSVLRSMRR